MNVSKTGIGLRNVSNTGIGLRNVSNTGIGLRNYPILALDYECVQSRHCSYGGICCTADYPLYNLRDQKFQIEAGQEIQAIEELNHA